MEEQLKVDPDYLKGFNEGYLMALYMPDFVDKLITAEVDSPRSAGFIAGRDQLIAEKSANKSVLPPWMRNQYDKEPPMLGAQPDKEQDPDIEQTK